MANTTFQSVQAIGLPEARIILSQCVTYLACSPKSNKAYTAINQAIAKVKETGNLPVPLHLRNAPTQLMKELDYGKDYRYAHDYPGNFVLQEYLPEVLSNTHLLSPWWQSQRRSIQSIFTRPLEKVTTTTKSFSRRKE